MQNWRTWKHHTTAGWLSASSLHSEADAEKRPDARRSSRFRANWFPRATDVIIHLSPWKLSFRCLCEISVSLCPFRFFPAALSAWCFWVKRRHYDIFTFQKKQWRSWGNASHKDWFCSVRQGKGKCIQVTLPLHWIIYLSENDLNAGMIFACECQQLWRHRFWGLCFFFFFICLNCEFWLWSLPGWGWIWICSLEKKQRLSVRASTHLKSNERGCAFVGTRKVIKLMSAFHFKGAMLYLRSLFVNVFTS